MRWAACLKLTSSKLVTLILAFIMAFPLTSCTSLNVLPFDVRMPDVIGLSPYNAAQLLGRDLESPLIVFVTNEGTEATVEREEHYSGWKVISTEPSANTIIGSNEDNKVFVTIKMTEEEGVRRNSVISGFIEEQQFLYGWAKDSIASYVESSYGLLILRFESKRSFFVGDPLPSTNIQSVTELLAQNLHSPVLLTIYTADGHLERVFYCPYRFITPEQTEQTAEWTAEVFKTADAYAAEHLDLFMDDYIFFRFGPYSENPDDWQSAEYAVIDEGVAIAVVLVPGKSFRASGMRLDEVVDSWRAVAERLTLFTRTNVSFSFYSSNGDLEFIATASMGNYLFNPYM